MLANMPHFRPYCLCPSRPFWRLGSRHTYLLQAFDSVVKPLQIARFLLGRSPPKAHAEHAFPRALLARAAAFGGPGRPPRTELRGGLPRLPGERRPRLARPHPVAVASAAGGRRLAAAVRAAPVSGVGSGGRTLRGAVFEETRGDVSGSVTKQGSVCFRWRSW